MGSVEHLGRMRFASELDPGIFRRTAARQAAVDFFAGSLPDKTES